MGFGKDGKGVIIRESKAQALGALAAGVPILIGAQLAILERFRIISLELTAVITGLTAGEGDGLLLGIADGNYDIAQIEAAIEANGPLGPNEKIEEELSERYTKILGTVDHEVGTEAVFRNKQGGYIIEETIRWTFARSKSWDYFVYNQGATLTTGATASIRAKVYGVWVI